VLIRLVRIGKRYGLGDVPIDALRDVSLSVNRGEAVAIMGPSGSGKSTLLSIMGCLDAPTTGGYLLDNVQVVGMSRARLAAIRSRHIGFVFQTFNLLARATALENVELPLAYAGHPARRRRAVAAEMLERVGLADRRNHMPSQLSGGQQQRVAIARALANRPDLILADEPTGALDLSTGREVLDLLQQVNREGTTVVVVTHDRAVAARMQRVILLQDGQICRDWAHKKDGPKLRIAAIG
jgi:putative ABC transport system ATP-binding protein